MTMSKNFITRHIPDSTLIRIEKSLTKIAGDENNKSIFQKAYDKIKGWKPNAALLNVILKIVKTVFKIPNLTNILLEAYRRAMTLQGFIDAGKMSPTDAQKKLRSDISMNHISQTLKVPSWLVNFLSEGVVVAIKILRSRYMK